jgi:hypothetical protein
MLDGFALQIIMGGGEAYHVVAVVRHYILVVAGRGGSLL